MFLSRARIRRSLFRIPDSTWFWTLLYISSIPVREDFTNVNFGLPPPQTDTQNTTQRVLTSTHPLTPTPIIRNTFGRLKCLINPTAAIVTTWSIHTICANTVMAIMTNWFKSYKKKQTRKNPFLKLEYHLVLADSIQLCVRFFLCVRLHSELV